jgi:hypothetical protein
MLVLVKASRVVALPGGGYLKAGWSAEEVFSVICGGLANGAVNDSNV